MALDGTRARTAWPAWRATLWGGAAALLLAPLLAMRITGDVAWTPGDVAAAAVLLGGAAAMIDAIVRSRRGRLARGAGVAAVLVALALIWLQLAVGLI